MSTHIHLADLTDKALALLKAQGLSASKLGGYTKKYEFLKKHFATAYYLMIGMVCGASVLASSFFRSDLQAEIRPNTILIVLSIVGVGVYILSWLLSIRFFKKREIH